MKKIISYIAIILTASLSSAGVLASTGSTGSTVYNCPPIDKKNVFTYSSEGGRQFHAKSTGGSAWVSTMSAQVKQEVAAYHARTNTKTVLASIGIPTWAQVGPFSSPNAGGCYYFLGNFPTSPAVYFRMIPVGKSSSALKSLPGKGWKTRVDGHLTCNFSQNSCEFWIAK